MKEKIIIVGAGGFAREVLKIIEAINTVQDTWEIVGFCDNVLEKKISLNGYPIIDENYFIGQLSNDIKIIIGIGDPQKKIDIVRKIAKSNKKYCTVIHPTVIISAKEINNIGEGSIIAANAFISDNVTIGKHVLINVNSVIGHDVTIGDFSSIMPSVNVSGEVVIEEACYIGVSSSIRNRVIIKKKAFIGMASAVVNDINEGVKVFGNPAREMFSPKK